MPLYMDKMYISSYCVGKTKMKLTHLTLFLSIALSPSLNQKLTPNAVTSLLQGIMSPKNTEQAIQIVSAVANKKMAMPGTVNRRFAIVGNVPRTVIRNEAPNKITQLVQVPKEMAMRKNVVGKKDNQMVLPKNFVVQRKIETVIPKSVIIQNGGEALPRNVIVSKNEMPKRVIVQNNDFSTRFPTQMRTGEVVSQKVLIPAQVQQKVLITQPQVTEYVTVPQKNVFVRNENPLLPAASPVSVITPQLSNALPSAIPQSRGQFLRKNPIPPPTL